MKPNKIPIILISIVVSSIFVLSFIFEALSSPISLVDLRLILGLTGILTAISYLLQIDNSVEKIEIKSYVIKKSSAKKIVEAMFSWNKLFSNPDFIPYQSIFYFSINSEGAYILKRTTSDLKGNSDYKEYFETKLDKNPTLIIKEVNNKYDKLSKYSVLLKQTKFFSVNFTILDEVNLEIFLNWIEHSLNKYDIDFEIIREFPNVNSTNNNSIEIRLLRLKELLNKGLINDQEYEQRKSQILSDV